MKTTKFFSAAVLFFSVATSFFFASCTSEEKDEQNHTPEYVQKKQQQLKNKVSDKKIISAEAEISEDITDLYDIKATYVYEGQTIVEDLEDLNEYNTIEKLEVIKLKKYGLVKDFGKSTVKVTITASLKQDAMARVEAMPDDKNFSYLYGGDIHNIADKSTINKGVQTVGLNGISKEILIKLLNRGDRQLKERTFE